MTKAILRIIFCIVLIGCIACCSLNAYAEESTLDFEINIQPVVSEPETFEQTEEGTEKQTEKQTEKETEKQTEKETERETERVTQKPTQKPTKAPEPSRNNNNNNSNSDKTTRPVQTTEETTEGTTLPPLPEGHFYVFLQKNNGERLLKTIMEGEGLLPAPSEPVRKGYIFDGWYADAKFKKPWSFGSDIVTKEMTIYAKWIADKKTVAYNIKVKQTKGGIIEVNPAKASEGEIVTIKIIPDEGKRLVAGSLLIDGAPTDIFSFTMKKGDVQITASFENIPDGINSGEEEKSKLPIIIGVATALVAAGVAIAAFAIRRRRVFIDGFDPDAVADANEYYDDWVDESITIEDGFKEGKIIRENVEPDFGLPDEDDD